MKLKSLMIFGSALAMATVTHASPAPGPETTLLPEAAPPAVEASVKPVVAPVDAKKAALLAATEEVLRETSRLRQLPILRPIKSDTQSRSKIERKIVEELKKDKSQSEVVASELVLKKLGLVPANFQLRPFVVKVMTEQVAGYYDTDTQRFYLADWIDAGSQKFIMAHELTHALQDQHFDLRRLEKWPQGDSDAHLAAVALVEGDATYTMTRWLMQNPLRAITLLPSMILPDNNSEVIDRAPRALREALMFPYMHGMSWTAQVYRRGGWKAVSQAFKQLPQSTEQILHPHKYFAREAPVKVALPATLPGLGQGWKRVDYDVNGEFGLYLTLDVLLNADETSKQATAGWGGDRYALFQGPQLGDLLLVQHTVWDTPQDAREFFEAYARRTFLRYKNDGVKETSRAGSRTRALRRTWRTHQGAVILERRGARVLIVEGIPQRINSARLLKSLWR
ncbi:MAG: hypothetical protein M3347_16920 [Armatimonadota bacterium]|nr:hypothetical protein [Armatimonadota bacterium]